MKRFYTLFLASLLVITHALPTFAVENQQTASKVLMWQLQSKLATIYLLGSVHVLKPENYPIDPVIETAFDQSDTLVVEVNILESDAEKIQQLILQKGVYQGQDTLMNNISKATLAKLEQHLQKHEIQLKLIQIQKLKPWLLAMTLTMQEITRLGYDKNLGLDLHFIRKASAQKKQILQLETAMQQILLLAEGNKDKQELNLLMFLEQYADAKNMIEELISAWQDGDGATLNQQLLELKTKNPLLQTEIKQLIDDRNIKMAARIEEFLKTKTKKTYMVIVGSLHLVGEKGIVELLRAHGHTLSQMHKAAITH